MDKDDFLLGKAPNKHNERVNNKRYLARKKRYHEKVSGENSDTLTVQDTFIDGLSKDIWQVSELAQTTSGKVISCFSRINGDSKIIELTRNDPLISSIVIGDYITLIENTIEGIVTRSNLLARYKGDSDRFSLHGRILHPIAANLDYVVVVASAKDPKFQPGFIDRYMLLTQSAGIPPIICISKSDLIKIDDPILKWYEDSLRIPVVYTSANTGEGIDDLKDVIHGKTVVFVGKSGVGKSSLANSIIGQEIIHTSVVSEKGGQGKHTTTSSKMHEWNNGSYIIDTPGIRSLDFLEFSKEELKLYFPEFEEPSRLCRFRDCLHNNEPDCGAKEAVKSGEIPEFRMNTYLRLLEDIA